MRRRRPTTGSKALPRARVPAPGAPADATNEKRSVPARQACFATSQGAWVNGPGNHHRAGAVRR